MAELRLEGLAKRFGGTAAVDGVDLAIRHGEFVSLLGPSGCGKTTTLRLIAGFLKPDGGKIDVDGRLLSSTGAVVPPERRNMSMIFQSYAVWPHKTVFENVAYGLQLRRVGRDEQRRRVGKMLEMVRLAPLASRYPSELSGGQQQRVALARALVIEPQILLLDEPLSNLDANLREEMRFEIRRLHDEFQITTVYVTHDQAEAMVTSDRIAVMNLGRLEQVGSPEEIYERPATTFVASFIGVSNVLRVERAGDSAVRVGPVTLQLEPGALSTLAAGSTLDVAIRPHAIDIHGTEPAGHANVLAGRVARAIYLGDKRDYLVETTGGLLRVAAPPGRRFQVDEAVYLTVEPRDCRPVARTPDGPGRDRL